MNEKKPQTTWESASKYKSEKESPGFLLWQVSTLWRRKIEQALTEYDLTHAQFVLLASLGYLAYQKRQVTQVELARYAKMDIPTTSQVLRSLQKKGLIISTHQGNDARAKYPVLTSAGQERLSQALPEVEKIDQYFFEPLKQDLNEFIRILQLLAIE